MTQDKPDRKMCESLVDFGHVAQAVDELSEIMKSMVNRLVSDGFTDREARAIVAGSLAANINGGGAT